MKAIAFALSITVIASCNSGDSKENASTGSDSSILAAPKTDSTVAHEADSSDNSLTDAEKAEGFKLLFDGKSKDGFHVFNNKTDGSAWKIVDGT